MALELGARLVPSLAPDPLGLPVPLRLRCGLCGPWWDTPHAG